MKAAIHRHGNSLRDDLRVPHDGVFAQELAFLKKARAEK